MTPGKRKDVYGAPERRPAIRALQAWTSHNGFDTSLALALSRSYPRCPDESGVAHRFRDWGPEALLWLYARDDACSDLIAQRLALVVLVVGERAGIPLTAERIRCAVLDAMCLARDRRCVSATARKRTLRLDKGNYLTLRRAAEDVLWKVISAALRRYLDVCGHLGAQGDLVAADAWTHSLGQRPLAPGSRHAGNHGPNQSERIAEKRASAPADLESRAMNPQTDEDQFTTTLKAFVRECLRLRRENRAAFRQHVREELQAIMQLGHDTGSIARLRADTAKQEEMARVAAALPPLPPILRGGLH